MPVFFVQVDAVSHHKIDYFVLVFNNTSLTIFVCILNDDFLQLTRKQHFYAVWQKQSQYYIGSNAIYAV